MKLALSECLDVLFLLQGIVMGSRIALGYSLLTPVSVTAGGVLPKPKVKKALSRIFEWPRAI